MTELKIKCTNIAEELSYHIDCNICKGTGSIPAEILSASDIYEKTDNVSDYYKKSFIELSQVQEIIDFSKKKVMDEVEKNHGCKYSYWRNER